ncbi:TetR/AcrR family transcriptional regulator [Haloferula sargassicola]|uniref:HTH tetR-type domain-containing protein n=1 Tax=Haloferula sargassicola TaxID=490096 RepID=A0ABP9UXJ0_9BACT
MFDNPKGVDSLGAVKASMTKVESGIATRQRLLEAAQELFALHGFDKVAVREVTEKAGANVAAVNYHFGSREGLVEKVIERYLTPINEERLARLERCEKAAPGKVVALEELLDAFVRPFVTQLRRSELSERLCLRLIGRLLGDQAKLPVASEIQFQMVMNRFKQAFERALPGVTEEDLIWRCHFMAGGMIHAMSNAEILQRMTQGRAGDPSMELTLSRFVRFAAAGLRQASGNPTDPGSEKAGENEEVPQGEFLF